MKDRSNKTVIDFFEEQAVLCGNNTALVCDNTSLSYTELNNKANALACIISRDYGLKKGDIVALLMDKCADCYISLLAVLKCGAIYLPLSADTPTERLHYIIESSGAKLLLTNRNDTANIAIPILRTNAVDLQSEANGLANSTPKLSPNDGAYIIYSSGTTGIPNGVIIPHRGIVRLVKGNDYFPFAEQHTFFQISNIGFDAATFEIWGALLNGHKLIATNQALTDLLVMETIINHHEVSTIFLTSSFFNLIISEKTELLAGLKYLIVGGEALSVKHIQKARLRFPELVLINGYGPTECTTFACCYRIPSDFDFCRSSIPIGQAITDTQLFLFDEKMQEVATGEKGELYIGGSGLALGYLNNAELSNLRFIVHPRNKKIRLYKTGDICRLDSVGNLLYIGRTDNQLKIRGFRVESEEVEHILSRSEAIDSCVVMGEKSEWYMELVAYITSGKAAETDTIQLVNTINLKALKQELSSWLPAYMIPTHFVELNRLPLTQNGKANKELLKTYRNTSTKSNNEILFNCTTEKTIYLIWKKHFPNLEIGLDDCFFEIGGDSLRALSVINDINTKLHINIPALSIYNSSTIRTLAAAINTTFADERKNLSITKLKDGEGEPIYLTSGLNGNELRFIDFAANFNKKNPLFFLNYPDNNIDEFDKYTMESLACYFIEIILMFKPNEKIHLLGYSFGGRLVYEMAIQLQKRKINIGLLCIIDIVGPKHSYNNLSKKDKIQNEIGVFNKLNFSLKYRYLKFRLPVLLHPLVSDTPDINNTESKIFDRKTSQIRAIYYRIFRNYKSDEKFNGTLLLIRTSISSLSPVDMVYYLYNLSQYNFWEFNLNSDIIKHEIDSGHIEILSKDNAKLVAEYVCNALG